MGQIRKGFVVKGEKWVSISGLKNKSLRETPREVFRNLKELGWIHDDGTPTAAAVRRDCVRQSDQGNRWDKARYLSECRNLHRTANTP